MKGGWSRLVFKAGKAATRGSRFKGVDLFSWSPAVATHGVHTSLKHERLLKALKTSKRIFCFIDCFK